MSAVTDKIRDLIGIGRPGGWDDVFVRALKSAVVAFAALTLKYGLDDFDATAATAAIDAAYIAFGTVLLNAALLWGQSEGTGNKTGGDEEIDADAE